MKTTITFIFAIFSLSAVAQTSPLKPVEERETLVKQSDSTNNANGLAVKDYAKTFKSQLYILDGRPISEKSIPNIDAADIESMEILKDGSSKNLHGEKANNGVIVIALKKNARAKYRLLK